MRPLLSLICLLLPLSSCSGVKPTAMSAPQAAAYVAATPQLQVLDVRSLAEYAGSHLQDAALVPWGEPEFTERALQTLDPKRPVLVYCRSGRRSSLAAVELRQAGFKEVRSLNGGILAWQEAGKPVITSE